MNGIKIKYHFHGVYFRPYLRPQKAHLARAKLPAVLRDCLAKNENSQPENDTLFKSRSLA
jgi:uncharacterized protein (DUF2267 family)